METVTITTLMGAAGDVFEAAIGCITNVGTAIAGSPILLLGCVGVPLCGISIGMFKRLLSSRV